MSEQQNQISKLAGALTEHQRHFGAMTTDERQWVITNTVAAVAIFVEAVKNRATTEVEKLLRFVRPVQLPAIPKFVVAEKLREGETIDGIRVAWVGPNVKANFLRKVEGAVPSLDIGEYELVTQSRDPAIITERGGEEQVETTFGQFWEFLKTADRALVHVRHIRDVNGVLWAVGGGWCDDGLDVGGRFARSPGWLEYRRSVPLSLILKHLKLSEP